MFEKKEKIKNVLHDEEVVVRYIRDNSRYKGNHLLAGGMHKDAGKTLTVRRRNKRVVPFLTPAEMDSLRVHGNLPELSWSNEEFWRDSVLEVKLINGDVRLKLNDPIDYIKYKMLLTYDLLIAPDWNSRENNATYRWVFVQNNDDADSANQELDLTAKAYMSFGEIRKDLNVLSYIYNKLEGKVISKDTKTSTVTGWFNEILKKKAHAFVKLTEDPILEEKALIYHALRAGIVKKSNSIYVYGDKKLTHDPKFCTIDEAAKFISEDMNNDIKLEIEAKLNI